MIHINDRSGNGKPMFYSHYGGIDEKMARGLQDLAA